MVSNQVTVGRAIECITKQECGYDSLDADATVLLETMVKAVIQRIANMSYKTMVGEKATYTDLQRSTRRLLGEDLGGGAVEEAKIAFNTYKRTNSINDCFAFFHQM